MNYCSVNYHRTGRLIFVFVSQVRLKICLAISDPASREIHAVIRVLEDEKKKT
jgi:hypothetical protein